MSKRFYTQIDLCGNQLLRAALQHIDSTQISGTLLSAGRIYYAVDLDKPVYCDGTNIREIFYRGESLDPRTIDQVGFDSTEKVLLVSAEDTTNWDSKQDGLGFVPENSERKNEANGYAGLDSFGRLSLSTLWAGMVVQSQDGSSWLTMGQLFDQPNGIPTLDSSGKISPLKIQQTGFDSTTPALLVSAAEKTLWNNVGNGGVEYQANKGAAGGYAPLDATSHVPRANLPDGVILRKIKKIEVFFDGTTNENDVFTYSLAGSASRQFVLDATTNLVGLMGLVVNSINSNTPENTFVIASHDSTSKITILGLNVGVDFSYAFSYVNFVPGNLTLVTTLVSAAYYDLSNIGGAPAFGFAPLNNNGVIDRRYLPSSSDLLVFQTYADLLNYPLESVFNGLRAFVVDATDDTTNNPVGSAEYIWLDSVPGWEIIITDTQITLSHQALQNLQGDGAGVGDVQHLTTLQLQKVRDAEYIYKTMHVNTDNEPATILQIPFVDTLGRNFRSARIYLTCEDHVSGVLVSINLDLLWDGNFTIHNEFGRLSNNDFFQLYFVCDHDTSYIYLKVGTSSTDASFVSRVAITEAIEPNLHQPIFPSNDLFPSDYLLIG